MQLSGPCPSPSRAIKLDSKDTKRLIYIKYLAHCRHSTDKLYLDLIVAVSRNIEPGLKNVSKSEPEPEVDLKLEGQNVAFRFPSTILNFGHYFDQDTEGGCGELLVAL